MSEWQPIETAPKDGTFVLLFCPDAREPQVALAQWLSFVTPDGVIEEWHDAYNDDSTSIDVDPSHWMPLPDAPK